MKMINNTLSQPSLSLGQMTRRAAVILASLGVIVVAITSINNSAIAQTTCDNGEFMDVQGNCQACPLGEVANAQGNGCDACADFDQIPTDDNSACQCPNGYSRDGNNHKVIDRTDDNIDNGIDQNGVGCVQDNIGCGQTGTIFTASNGQSICLEYDEPLRALPDYPHPAYNQTRCQDQGGNVFRLIDDNDNVGEFCQVAICVVDDVLNPDSCNNPSPNRESPRAGDSFSSCVMRSHSNFGFDSEENPECRVVFGSNNNSNAGNVGFPNLRGYVNVERRGATSLTDTTPFPSSGGSSASAETIRIGVAAAVGIGVLLYAGGNTDAFHLVPHAKLNHKNGVSYYDYGSRLQFQQDNIEVQWSAARAHTKDTSQEWTYGTNARWSGDVFEASLINQSSGLVSDTSFSVSARRQFGAWTLHSGANADWNVNKLNAEWKSGMSIGADGVYNKWTIKPLAEFSWHDSNNQNTQFQVNLEHDL